MQRAQRRDAVLNEKFLFRRGLATCNTPPEAKTVACCREPSDDIVEMTINEIVNGMVEYCFFLFIICVYR